MSTSNVLRLLCWDHPRCVLPMTKAVDDWNAGTSHAQIELHTRPLALFNEQPTIDLVDDWDLLLIDHPGIGECQADGALAPLDEHLDPALIAELRLDSAGPSHESYAMDGHQYALAVDAACHTSATRVDEFARLGLEVPNTWLEVRQLARQRQGSVIWPLFPADVLTSTLGITHQLAKRTDADLSGVDELISVDAIELLLEMLTLLHPASLDLNPPQALDLMAQDEGVIYAPRLFCYADYQRTSRPHPISFGHPPVIDPGRADASGSILGGAGIAVSAHSSAIAEAVEFTAWVMDQENQSDVVPSHGGQPGRRSAWVAQNDDADRGPFFRDVLPVLESAIVRPRDAHWPSRQERAGIELCAGLRDGSSATELHKRVGRQLRSEERR